jgi:hypothetical protein
VIRRHGLLLAFPHFRTFPGPAAHCENGHPFIAVEDGGQARNFGGLKVLHTVLLYVERTFM